MDEACPVGGSNRNRPVNPSGRATRTPAARAAPATTPFGRSVISRAGRTRSISRAALSSPTPVSTSAVARSPGSAAASSAKSLGASIARTTAAVSGISHSLRLSWSACAMNTTCECATPAAALGSSSAKLGSLTLLTDGLGGDATYADVAALAETTCYLIRFLS